MVKLQRQGWTDKRIAQLLRCSRNTVMKWLRRARLAELQPRDDQQPWLIDLSRAPIHPPRKVQFGTIHAVLTLQKKYGYAGWFRIKGYLEQDYGDPLWMRDPIEPESQKTQRPGRKSSEAKQLRLYLGPELVKSA